MGERHPTLLITGFGPFPGYPSNASGLLAHAVADRAARCLPGCRVRAATLPTEWIAGPMRLAQLDAELRPALAIHFGISRRARGFVIECRARNIAARAADAIGALPPGGRIVPDGPETLSSTLPAGRILARLRRLGVPAALSQDAGSYLCNAILYHSLAAAREDASRRGFVHVPPGIANGMARCQLDWNSAVIGGLEIVRTCLGGPAP
ncbi:MAG TPA: pyroglutamyl-peptidase I [Hyphomicrobiaceae bacterium]|nr:pyroglutamyl-peptidase I [Hyphomicrobiaceae bacterium]